LFSANCLTVLLMTFLLSSTVRLASTQGSHVLKCSFPVAIGQVGQLLGVSLLQQP
jgi:hypothetical protein